MISEVYGTNSLQYSTYPSVLPDHHYDNVYHVLLITGQLKKVQRKFNEIYTRIISICQVLIMCTTWVIKDVIVYHYKMLMNLFVTHVIT